MLYILIIIGVASRLLPHPPNFAPLMALGLFAGAYLNKKTAYLVPIAAMLIADYFIGFYDFRIMLSVYLCFGIGSFLGVLLKDNKTVSKLAVSTIVASVIFFIVTNFTLWYYGGFYDQTADGLILCYTMAIPFFANSLLGNAVYVLFFFGSYELFGKQIDLQLYEKLQTVKIKHD